MGDSGGGPPRNYRQQEQQRQKHQQGGVGFHRYVGRGGRGGRPPRSSWKLERPPTSDSWKPTVPSWEKEFCYHVGSVPWKKVSESKSLLPFYRSVAMWDDSACEEAFHNAKVRYRAHINGLPCDIPLPDPDMYIDEVDWNATPDPQLILDLENRTSAPPSDEEGKKSSFLTTGWEAFFVPEEDGWVHPADENARVTTSGWGDGKKEDTDQNIRWWVVDEDGPSWDNSYSQGQWGNNSSWRWHKDKQWGQWKNASNDSDCRHHSKPRGYGKKRDGNAGGRWYGGQRDRNLRHWDGDNHQSSNNNTQSYCRGRWRTSQANEHASDENERAAPEPWRASCGRMGRYASREVTGVWVARGCK